MSEERSSALPSPTESVTIDLGDGIERPLRYTIATMRRLKSRLGLTMIGLQGLGMLTADEATIPEIIFEGLHDELGNPPEGVTLEGLLKLPAAATPYLLRKFSDAYTASIPEKKMPWDPKPRILTLPGTKPN